MYCRLAQPKTGIINLIFEGLQAQFYVNSPVELRIIEAPLEKGMGEYKVLNKLIQTIQPGDTCWDIGASLGAHAIFMAKKVGKNGQVVAFEPDTKSFEKLEANINLNGLNNIMLLKIALGGCVEEGYLKSYGGGFGAFSMTEFENNKMLEKVNIVSGDILIAQKILPNPMIVKMDVEGYEYATLKGMEKALTNKLCRMVCCEVHPEILPVSIKPKMVVKLLESYGFNQIETVARGTTFHLFCFKIN